MQPIVSYLRVLDRNMGLIFLGSLLFQVIQMGVYPILLTQILAGQQVDNQVVGIFVAFSCSRGDAVCARIFSAAEPGACRADWACADAGTRTLVCVVSDDAKIQCSCLENDEAVVTKVSLAPCESESALPKIASSLCGWSVP